MDDAPVFFLDANILMYAIGKEHPYKAPCVQVLHQIKAESIRVVTSTEVLQELLYRYFSVRAFDVATEVFNSTKILCETILPVDLPDLDLAHDLLKAHPGIKVRDAIHAATMLNHELTQILSADRHFDSIPDIQRVDPADLV